MPIELPLSMFEFQVTTARHPSVVPLPDPTHLRDKSGFWSPDLEVYLRIRRPSMDFFAFARGSSNEALDRSLPEHSDMKLCVNEVEPGIWERP